MKLVEMIKNGLVKLTVESCVDELKAKGWERIGEKKPLVVEPQPEVADQPKKTRKPRVTK